MRVFLSALGIAIGIAAMTAVVGISASSKAAVDRDLAALGTNLLTAAPGQTLRGTTAQLPKDCVAMVERMDGVVRAAATAELDHNVYRNDRMPAARTGGIEVYAVQESLLATLDVKLTSGVWFNAARSQYPTVVLGADAAARLGIGNATEPVQVYVGGKWFTVIGILPTITLASELDNAVLVGWEAAQQHLGFDGHPERVYTIAEDGAVAKVRDLLGATVNPENPNEVKVSRPSDALAAREATDEAFTALLLGLGGVALLVGGVGVANTMVISVLERRAEIGMRRALGAARWHVCIQFVAESLLLATIGGFAGVGLGALATTGYATPQGWPALLPVWASAGGVLATVVVGALAGAYPAIRAARLSPTEALAAPS